MHLEAKNLNSFHCRWRMNVFTKISVGYLFVMFDCCFRFCYIIRQKEYTFNFLSNYFDVDAMSVLYRTFGSHLCFFYFVCHWENQQGCNVDCMHYIEDSLSNLYFAKSGNCAFQLSAIFQCDHLQFIL